MSSYILAGAWPLARSRRRATALISEAKMLLHSRPNTRRMAISSVPRPVQSLPMRMIRVCFRPRLAVFTALPAVISLMGDFAALVFRSLRSIGERLALSS